MKLKQLMIIILVILVEIALFHSCKIYSSKQLGFNELFPEQSAPNKTPEIFALGIISSNDQEHSSLSFSPDGKEIWWSLWHLPHDLDKYPQVIKYIKFENKQWSKPLVASFSGTYRDGGPAFSPDGNRIYFYSRRPLNKKSEVMHDNDIWYVERTQDGWSQAFNLGKPVNTEYVEATPCLANNGNLYFTSNRNQYDDPTGNNDIFVSHYHNGVFGEPVSVSDKINTTYARESFPYISFDETYIIFSRDSRKFDTNGNCISGNRKMMISFKDEKGEWLNPVDMGTHFENTRFPSVSPDRKYLFFTKYSENTSEDFYWVDASVIDELKPKHLK